MKTFGTMISAGLRRSLCLCVSVVALAGMAGKPAFGLRIRDAVRMKNEVPNELTGMGLIMGLAGTGDGGDFMGTMRPLGALMKLYDDPVSVEKELKNANNVAIVTLSMAIPTEGAHSGEKLDVQVSALAAKSLKGGHLFVVPLYAPGIGQKRVLGWATGIMKLPDEKHLTEAVIPNGGTLIEDILPEEIKDSTFTLVLHPKLASFELATAIAEQINEDVAPQTGGKAIATATDDTSVQVTIPQVEQAAPVPFIARLLSLPLPTLPGPARVVINKAKKTMVFSDEVEVAPTLVSQGNLTITIGQPANPSGSRVPFVALDPKNTGNAKLKDLQDALNLLKVSADDRIAIVEELWTLNALKAELIED